MLFSPNTCHSTASILSVVIDNGIAGLVVAGSPSKIYNAVFALMAVLITSNNKSIFHRLKRSSHQSQFALLLFSIFCAQIPFVHSPLRIII